MLKNKSVLMGAATIALLVGGAARAQDAQGYVYSPVVGPYVGVAAGANWFNDVSPRYGGVTGSKNRFDPGYEGLATFGWGLGDGFRTELEGGYRRSTNGLEIHSPVYFGSLGMYTVMVNGLYDFNPTLYGMEGSPIVPHLGIGVGWARARFSNAGYYSGPPNFRNNIISGQDNFLAYQGIAGFDYAIYDGVKMSLDYHYLGTGIGHFTTRPGSLAGATSTSTSLSDQSLLLGVKFEFDTAQPVSAPMAAPMAAPPPPPPRPAPVVAAPEAQRSFQVFFDFDKSDLTDAARQVVQQAATTINAGHAVHILVTGHTDTVGSAKYNQALSERRAAAVKQGLEADGVSDGQIETRGVGKTGLLVSTGDGVREPQNRRATIDLQPGS